MNYFSYMLVCMIIFLIKDFKTAKSKQMYIVGGGEVDIKNYPYVVSIIIKHREKVSFRGAATIVHSHFAMSTAASTHFIAPNMIDHKFVYLRGNTANWSDGVTGQDHQIEEIWTHDGFSEVTFENDFSVIRIKQPFNGQNERIISIADPEYQYTKKAKIFGWGSTAPEKFKEVDILRMVEVDILSLERCKGTYNLNGSVILVTNTMLCAGNEGKDTCTKDGGGPMIQNNILIGIISWGSECGNAKYPTVYSKISAMDSAVRRAELQLGTQFNRKKKRHGKHMPNYDCKRRF